MLSCWVARGRRCVAERPSNRATSQPALAITAALALLAATSASACPVCYGGADSLAKGMDSAIWFLLSVLGFVQIGFIALFWSFWRRSRALRRRREEFHLIEGGAR